MTIGMELSDEQFVAFSEAVVRALPRDMNPADARALTRNHERLQEVLKSVLCQNATPLRSPWTLVRIAQESLGFLEERTTVDCFQGGWWLKSRGSSHPSGWDEYGWGELLPVRQQSQVPCCVSSYEVQGENITWTDLATTVLGVNPNTPASVLVAMLRKSQFMLTVSAISSMVEMWERGEGFSILYDQKRRGANLCFIEGRNESVSFVRFRFSKDWFFWVEPIGFSDACEGSRLLLCNSDASLM